MTTTTATRIKSISYETVDCHRCGGTGAHGPLSVHGGRCFGCNGKGVVVSRAGLAAKARVEEVRAQLCTVAASSVKPGDRIVGSDGKVRTVVDVEVRLGRGNGSGSQGVRGTDTFMEYVNLGVTTITTKAGGYQGPAHREVTLAWTQETLAAAAAAVADMEGATVVYAD